MMVLTNGRNYGQVIIIKTYAGDGLGGFSGDGGPATVAKLTTPSGVALDKTGNLYIADQNGNRIRKVSTLGIISTVAGNGGIGGFTGDSVAATATSLFYPEGVAVDKYGNVYIADEFNDRVRKVDTNGYIFTIAGDGFVGFTGDGGPATNAQLWHPQDVAVDSMANIYIVDQDNSAIRKVSLTGIITTLAGNGTAGYLGDGGPSTNALLNFPAGIAVDPAGRVFIADLYNNRVRKIDLDGMITTIAGIGTAGFAGDGGAATAAELFYPSALAVDTAGNVFVSDATNNRIRKISATGIITTVVGNGTGGTAGDGGPATAAEISNPQGVAVNQAGNIFIADYSNSKVRKVGPGPITLNITNLSDHDITVFPNPVEGCFRVNMGTLETGTIIMTDAVGRHVLEKPLTKGENFIYVQDIAKGFYNVVIQSENIIFYNKLIVN